MGSLYSLSPVYMNYRHTARKPAHQQHEAICMVKAGGCDPCVCACVCMLTDVWVCAQACLLSCVGVRYVCVFVSYGNLLIGIFISMSLKSF